MNTLQPVGDDTVARTGDNTDNTREHAHHRHDPTDDARRATGGPDAPHHSCTAVTSLKSTQTLVAGLEAAQAADGPPPWTAGT